MWCCNLTKNHGLLLVLYIIFGVDSLTSSTTDCQCPNEIGQNAHCSKQSGCTKICNDGYWGESCQFGRIRLTSSRGYITDGFNSYSKLSKRIWFIDSGNRNASIHFQIDEFATECNWDHLYIFDGDSTDAPLLAAFNGHLIGDVNSTSVGQVPQDIIAKSGSAYIYFYSDLGEVRTGFNITYRIDNCACVNGKCTAAGLCVCDASWDGIFCDIQKNCSNTFCLHGACNETSGKCDCLDGFTGKECSQPIIMSFWTALKTENSEIFPRSSHAAAVIGGDMWVYNGYKFSHRENLRNLHRYNLQEGVWTTFPGEDLLKWGHSMIAYQDKLYVFGGMTEDHTILDRLTVFDTNTTKWNDPRLDNLTAVAVTGHTATIVGDKMIVIFGLSIDGLFPGVQEYDIVKSEWQIIKSANSMARYGHSSVYDPFSEGIYVYGGFALQRTSLDSLMVYYPRLRKWVDFPSSNFPQKLHSAVILDRMMIVFGGNSYIDNLKNDMSCHTTKLHLYDLVCQKWRTVDLPQVAKSLARYGHTAVTNDRKMFVFGGFNGAMFNDILIYTHGECNRITNETNCMKEYFTSGCYWNDTHCVNKDSLNTSLQCADKKTCSEIRTCGECTSRSSCGWNGTSCQVNGSKTCPPSSLDICSYYLNCNTCYNAGCHWTSTRKCQKEKPNQIAVCGTACHNRKTLETCTSVQGCLWCENLQRCGDSKLYVVDYHYGQCFEWTAATGVDKDVSCSSKSNCQDCFTLPSCGWSEDVGRTGFGSCLKGSVAGPDADDNNNYWHFFKCPLCQCNGHSNCSANSSVCLNCRDHTTGEHCDTCAIGYFGKPLNGGQCRPCDCNGHADTCNHETGRCDCRMKGVTGDHCDSCTTQYVGNASNGGFCYYTLQPDYLYTINVSEKTIFNFICSPKESDKDAVVTVNILRKGDAPTTAMLNISTGSDTRSEMYLLTNVDLSRQYEETFSKDNFPFGSGNFHFRIYVYNITPHSSISISVHQPNDGGIDLLKFFIIFLACFVGLLIFAVIFWKAKVFFDTFRRTRRRNVELVYMTNRPFASVPICVDKPGHVPMKNKPSSLTSELCYGNKAAVVTVLVRLPLCAQTENASNASSLCLGSALVNCGENQGSKMVNYMKNIKRRRNPFRSSPT